MSRIRGWIKSRRYRRELAKLAGPKILASLVDTHPDLYFVQVGANDGAMMDPVRSSVLKSRWRGWMLEPVPELYQKLKDNYACAGQRVVPVNAALSSEDGWFEFFHLSESDGLAPLPAWAAGLGSFRRDVILKHRDRIPQLEQYLQSISVPSFTWKTFCREQKIERVDLLVVDVEGYDFEVVRQLDYRVHRPFLVIYEHHHFDDKTEEQCIKLLTESGYRLFREGLDTWALDATQSDEHHRAILANLSKWVTISSYAEFVSP